MSGTDARLPAAERLRWRVRRLRSMSVPEVAWRCAQVGREAWGQRSLGSTGSEVLDAAAGGWETTFERFRGAVASPVLLDRDRAATVRREHPEQVHALIEAADGVLAGRVRFFGHDEVTLSCPVDWHHDPLAGFRWPRTPSRRIDHRAAGDPKWIWELNRLQYLPWLAEAWLHTGRDAYAEGALDLLDSWIEDNPPGHGITWQNAFEVGIRSISIGIAVQGLRDSPALTPARFERIVRLLATSADECWRRRSRFSSANNHLVGELAGLAVISILVPDLHGARRRRARAVDGLAAEASRQILRDGAGAEQAVGYQVFTCELLLVVAALLRAGGESPPPAMTAAIARSARYLAVLVGDEDPAPRYGDDDEGFALRLDATELRTVRDHLGVVAAFTGDPVVRRAGTPTLTSAWFATLPGSPDPAGRTDVAEHGPHDLFAPDGGLVLLRSGGRRLMMDVGPLGHLSIAAHGHADALSVCLSNDGRELIGDPGTASYFRHPEWRRAHRGTRAHATVTVDGEDQSVMAGPFLWSSHARVRVRSVDLPRGIVDAEHDGYRRLADPVVHRRWLVAPPAHRTVLVVDLVEGEDEHSMCVSWPLHPSLTVHAAPEGHVATRDDVPVLQVASTATVPVRLDRLHGDRASNLGWWSERLEQRRASWLVSATSAGPTPMAAATVLRPLGLGESVPVTGLAVELDPPAIRVRWREQGESHEAVIDISRSGSVRHLAG